MLKIEVIKKGAVAKYRRIYIGRPSIFGNPFKVRSHTVEDHNSSCLKFKTYLWNRIFKRDELYFSLLKLIEIAETEGVSLECFCVPLPCHGDILKEAFIKLFEIKEK